MNKLFRHRSLRKKIRNRNKSLLLRLELREEQFKKKKRNNQIVHDPNQPTLTSMFRFVQKNKHNTTESNESASNKNDIGELDSHGEVLL